MSIIEFPKEAVIHPKNEVPINEGMFINVMTVFRDVLNGIYNSSMMTEQDKDFDIRQSLINIPITGVGTTMENDLNGAACYKYRSQRATKASGELIDLWVKFNIERKSLSEGYIGYLNTEGQSNRFRILFVENVNGSIKSFEIAHPTIVSSNAFRATYEKDRMQSFYYQFKDIYERSPEEQSLIEYKRWFYNFGKLNIEGSEYEVFIHNSMMHETSREIRRIGTNVTAR